MNRRLVIAIPLLVALLLAVWAISALLAFPVAARGLLQSYVSQRGDGYCIERVVRAGRPWQLTEDLELSVWGGTGLFRTDELDPQDEPWQPPSRPAGAGLAAPPPSDQRIPLPYPPQEVWCALLANDGRRLVVFVARHNQEPHHTEWLVHESRDEHTAPEVQAILEALACDASP